MLVQFADFTRCECGIMVCTDPRRAVLAGRLISDLSPASCPGRSYASGNGSQQNGGRERTGGVVGD